MVAYLQIHLKDGLNGSEINESEFYFSNRKDFDLRNKRGERSAAMETDDLEMLKKDPA